MQEPLSTLSFADFYTMIQGTGLPCAGLKALRFSPRGCVDHVQTEEDLAAVIGKRLAAALWIRFDGARGALRWRYRTGGES